MDKDSIAQIRGFNRFYTNVLGLMDKYLLDSDYALAEARVLFEIHDHVEITASEIIEIIGIDKSYLSRILKGFNNKALIERVKYAPDSRISKISLTAKGLEEFCRLNEASDSQIFNLIKQREKVEVEELIYNMNNIIKIISKNGNHE